MIVPTRIEVTNIRSIAHAVITPSTSGVTAITGPIGAGKSTLFDAHAYALYGDGIGLRQADMRKTDADSDLCEVTTTFAIGSDVYEATRGVRRKNRRGVPGEDAYARLTINGDEVHQMTPTRLTDTVVKATGLTGAAYIGAFYIPQGQLNVLADATPSTVQQTFEDQVGMTVLTKEVASASSTSREAHAAANALPGSIDDVDDARTILGDLETAATATWHEHEAAAARAAQAVARHQVTATTLTGLQQAAQAAQAAREAVARHSGRAEQERAAEKAARQQASDVDADKVAAAEQTERDLTRAVNTTRNADAEAARTRGRASDLTARVPLAQDALTAWLASTGSDDAADLTVAADTAREAVATHRDRYVSLRADHARTEKVIGVLTVTDAKAAHCPTCSQEVADVAALIAQQREALAKIADEGKAVAAQQKAAEAALSVAEDNIRRLTDLTSAVTRAQDAAIEATTIADTAQRVFMDAHSALRALLATATDDLADITIPEHIDLAEQRIDDARAIRAAASIAMDAARRADQHAAAATEATAAAAAAEEATHGAPDADQVAQAISADTTAADARRAADTEAATARTLAMVDAEKVTAAQRTLDAAQTLWNAKVTAAHQADVASNAHSLLAELRRDMLADYLETVSAAATEILGLLGGEHVGFVIDETFTPRVVLADGTTRTTRVLSGGEKARAALCFRLGITHQITGGQPTGMILADEITAAHDDETRQAVVQMLSDLGVPVMIIAHTDDVTQIANTVVRATRAPGGGTTLSVVGESALALV